MIKILKKLNKKQILFMLIITLFIVLQVWLDLKLPDYMNNITVLIQTEGTKTQELFNPGIKMLLCALGSLCFSIIASYFCSTVGTSVAKNLRSEVFRKVGSFSAEEISKFSISSLITRTTNDITQIQMIVAMGLQLIIKAPITAIWAITKIAGKSFSWSLLTTIAIILLLVMIIILITKVIPKFKIVQKLNDNINRVTRENILGIRVVRAYNAEEYQNNKFNEVNEELTKTHMYTQKVMGLMSPYMSFILNTLSLLIYVIGAYLINKASMLDKVNLFGDMIVFSSYAMQIVSSFIMLAMIFIMYPRVSVSVKRINEVLDTEVTIKEGNISTSENAGTIEFKNVSFKYPDAEEYVLEGISFKANKGETIAIIGSTGCGKSTLVNLIPRFYDVTEGEVLVDNINVKEYTEEHLNNKIGYVSQRAVIFSGSVKENVMYGSSVNKITEKDVEKSLEVAQALDFVSALGGRLDAHISQGGTNLSGGQKQRISISRAIARDPKIYIFDDSFSALDYKTDLKLRRELKKYTKDSTIFIVASRIGTIKDADKIIVLDDGKCVGIGKHEELLNDCKVYKEIALSQLSEEELKNA